MQGCNSSASVKAGCPRGLHLGGFLFLGPSSCFGMRKIQQDEDPAIRFFGGLG